MDVEPIYNQLCSLCQDLFSKEPVLNVQERFRGRMYHERLHHDFRDLELAVQDGCHICALLHTQIPAQTAEDLRRNLQQSTVSWKPSFIEFRSDEVDYWRLEMRFGRMIALPLHLIVSSMPDSKIDRVVTSKALGDPEITNANSAKFVQPSACRTDSHSSLDQVRAWLDNCFRRHGPCHDSKMEIAPYRRLPTRLIDTGILEEDWSIRLVDGSQLNEKTQYIALSHCWGGRCPITLTKQTASLFARHIEASTLPKTFSDVTWLARELGIRYLWIDALCILQDSEEDWRIESSRMLEVYSFAALTVAATASQNAHEGLFFTRSCLAISPSRIGIDWEGRPGRTLVVYHPKTLSRSSMVETAPLSQRAWALQERLLSQRVLHCSRDQLHWECCCLQAREVYPEGTTYPVSSWTKLLSLRPLQDTQSSVGAHSLDDVWSRIRMKFRKANITVDTDRLVALSGIARKMRVLMHREEDDYLAGLERKFLLSELLWTVNNATRPVEYCAPTWSWASTKGTAGNDLVYHDNCVEILEAKAFPISGPYGQVSRGYLRLCGMLYEITLIEKHTSSDVLVSKLPSKVEAVQFNRSRIDVTTSGVYHTLKMYWDGDTLDTLGCFNGFSLHCLLLRWGQTTMRAPESQYAAGLFLKQTHKKRGQYQRVGPLEIEAEELFKVFDEACAAKPLPEDAYQDKMRVEIGRGCWPRDFGLRKAIKHICTATDSKVCEAHLRNNDLHHCGRFPGRDRYTVEII